jgi:hypothetical protein
MNIISYPVFLLLQSLLGLTLIGTTILAMSDDSSLNTSIFALFAAGFIQIVVALSSKNKKYLQFADIIDIRISALIFFIISLLLTFSPYLLSFVDNTLLVASTTSVSAITLISFIFADLTLQDEDITE